MNYKIEFKIEKETISLLPLILFSMDKKNKEIIIGWFCFYLEINKKE